MQDDRKRLDVTWVEVEEGDERVTSGVGQLLDALAVVRESQPPSVTSAADQAAANAASVAETGD